MKPSHFHRNYIELDAETIEIEPSVIENPRQTISKSKEEMYFHFPESVTECYTERDGRLAGWPDTSSHSIHTDLKLNGNLRLQ